MSKIITRNKKRPYLKRKQIIGKREGKIYSYILFEFGS